MQPAESARESAPRCRPYETAAIPALAYFYPFTITCEARNARVSGETLDELSLLEGSLPRFDGHEVHRYSLDAGGEIREWDNSDPGAIARQVALAKEYDIGFLGLMYAGTQSGRVVHEMMRPLQLLAEESEQAGIPLGILACLNLARAKFPVTRYGGAEAGRALDLSTETAHVIVETAAKEFWVRSNYLRMNGRPYLSFCAFHLGDNFPHDEMRAFVTELRRAAALFGEDPYIVAVIWDQAPPTRFDDIDVDGFTSYAHLPDFARDAPPIQEYTELMIRRVAEWQRHAHGDRPFVPSVALGWDASSRAEQGYPLEEVAGLYPFAPIVSGAHAPAITEFVRAQLEYLERHVPFAEAYLPIFAWNEITEGGALLPRRDSNPLQMLEAVKEARRQEFVEPASQAAEKLTSLFGPTMDQQISTT